MTGIEFAIVALAGVLIGRFLPNRRKGHTPTRPICGCKHHYSFHDPKTGHCNNRDWDGCACRQYTGPEPLPEFYAPELTQ